MTRRTLVVAVMLASAALAFGAASCVDDTPNGRLPSFVPTAPSPPPSPTPPGPVPAEAIVVSLGEPLSGVIRGSDPPCDEFTDPLDSGPAMPCRTFQVTAPATGYVLVAFAAADRSAPAPCTLYQAYGRTWTNCSKNNPAQIPVLGGMAYPFGIAMPSGGDVAISQNDTLAFTMTATFTTTPRYGSTTGGR